MNISGPFIRRPIGTALLAIGLFVVGLMCYLKLGVSALPNIQIPVIFVHASQSGADATTMASTVTARWSATWASCPAWTRCARPAPKAARWSS